MASYYFLEKQFEEVMVYLGSIKSYFYNDDTFNYNYGYGRVSSSDDALTELQTSSRYGGKLCRGRTFSACSSERETQAPPAILTVLSTCLLVNLLSSVDLVISNKKAEAAWDLYKKTRNPSESFALLRLIANDSFKVRKNTAEIIRLIQVGEYYTSAKAFHAMERVDPNPEYWEGKRGACCGVFKLLTKNQAKRQEIETVPQIAAIKWQKC